MKIPEEKPKEEKVKMIYKGPPHKVLIIKTHRTFNVNDGDIFEATKGEAEELLKHSKNPRYKGREFSAYKEAKKSSGKGE